MANLVISNVCNLHCAYCFARDFLNAEDEGPDGAFISEQAFEERLDFLERSGIEDVRLIGGEPSLHPRFGELLQRAERRFQKIVVFSNGILSDTALAALEALPPEHLTVMVNLGASRASGDMSEAEQRRRGQALHRLGERVIAAYTIAGADFNCDPLVPLILENGCRKSIRLGLAQPALAGKNAYLHPKQYPVVGKRIVAFALRSARAGLRVEFDCGFVRCMFTNEDLEKLAEVDAYTGWRCNAVLDIDLQGQISHCFPLAGRFVAAFSPQVCAAELREGFTAQTKPYRVAGIYKECSTCPYKLGNQCTGGCLAATLTRFRKASFHFTGKIE